MNKDLTNERRLGLIGATSVGVGAIVGGGILALAGTAFAVTGPAAMLAFALNGVIALLTALSFAEMASRFPESGGTYTFSRKVMSVEAAFSVGWVVCFASIVAAVLYALGLAHFVIVFLNSILSDRAPALLSEPWLQPALAIVMTLLVGAILMLKSAGGGNWTNIAKLIVFGVLVMGGLWAVARQPVVDTQAALTPFFTNGFTGLIQAMGYTFIALQGFDLIAAVGGDVRNPARNLPRAMIISLLVALAVYLPLLFVISTVGVQTGGSIAEAAKADPEGIVATAARCYLGAFGYWLVVVAAILAMYSALEANVYAASRIIYTMARDRTLPSMLSRLNATHNPTIAVATTAGMISILILLIPDVATAGAASSLIFLMTFALAHWISILVRKRSGNHPPPFRTPWFPVVPVLGGIACLVLALFQGVLVPSAGIIAAGWLAIGSVLFLWLFAGRARIRDASAAANNPELLRLRGRSPLVLVPIANPQSAEPLITLANSLVPGGIGRVLMQTIVVAPDDWNPDEDPQPIERSQAVMKALLKTTARLKVNAETLTTIASQPMPEIARVAALHRCQSVVMGLSEVAEPKHLQRMERLLAAIDLDVVILRARENWQLSKAERILVPVAGRGGHEYLMSGVLGSLSRDNNRKITYLRVMPPGTSHADEQREQRAMRELAEDQMRSQAEIQIVQHKEAAIAIAEQAQDFDLIILGATRSDRKAKVIGKFTQRITELTDCPLLVLSSQTPG